jgi:hypothetical protein
MNNKHIKIILTLISIVGIGTHLVFPSIAIDSVTVALLIIGVLPWLSSLFKSFGAGGVNVEFRDLEKAEEELNEAKLIKIPSKEQVSYLPREQDNPILSLAWLRIEIEKRIRMLNGLCKLPENRDFNTMLRQLVEKEILNQKEYSALRDLRGTLNKAVHGEDIDSNANEWAFRIGSSILSALDDKLKIYEESCNL